MYFFIYSATLVAWYSGQKQLEVSDVLFDAGFSSKEEAESFGVRPGDSIVPQTETIKTANGKILSVNHGITAMVVRWY